MGLFCMPLFFFFLSMVYNVFIFAECSLYVNSTLIKVHRGLKMGGNYTSDTNTFGQGRGAGLGTIAH